MIRNSQQEGELTAWGAENTGKRAAGRAQSPNPRQLIPWHEDGEVKQRPDSTDRVTDTDEDDMKRLNVRSKANKSQLSLTHNIKIKR